MTRIILALMLLSFPAVAEDCENPCTLEMRASVKVYPIASVSEEICLQNPDATGCEDVTYMPEQKHPCEIDPEQTGCAFYQIEPASGGVYE